MKALVLEKVGCLRIRDIDIRETLGANDLKIAIHTVGICGSDIHYYEKGAIGSAVVNAPMILGHEASGTVIETGENVRGFKAGDRVCMEPGIPDPEGRATRLGIYNLDPSVRFWATPPVHGCLRETVIHPAGFTFKLPKNISFAEGAMVEPLAVGMHAAKKAEIQPGDVAVVTGAGTIGLVTVISALAGGCSKVIVSDIQKEKLEIAKKLGAVVPVDAKKDDLKKIVLEETNGWGADIVFEASASESVIRGIFDLICPGGTVVFIGMPTAPVAFDIVMAQAKEARMQTVFRYAHNYPRALALMESGKIDLKPLITDVYGFKDSIQAYEYARHMKPTSVKVQIEMS